MTIPIVNTHVHVPPNFSAFTTPADVVSSAAEQGVSALGISNFYDQQVYPEFASLAAEAQIVPLFGLEFITLIPELAEQGVRINDPANPGRMYLCGKGINLDSTSAQADATALEIRAGNDARAEVMVERLADHLQAAGLEQRLSAATITAEVAARAQVSAAWVSLQERHIARAVQEAIAALPLDKQAVVLERAYGSPPTASLNDPVATQAEVRAKLLKIGTPGFAPEVALSFDSAYAYVLAKAGIPCYPTLADGVDPVCPFEADPQALAQHLLDRGIYLAELIPIRNATAVVDRYVAAFTAAGIAVVAGTEHNTADRIPLDPAAIDGPLSQTARQTFFDGACLVAAHQLRVAAGMPGYVDATGARVSDVSVLVAEGAAVLGGEQE